jgi:transcriptional regulator with XRE-family HTH domain
MASIEKGQDDPHGIRAARLARGWTERELARRAGVPYQRIQSLERATPTGKATYSRYLADVMKALRGPDEWHPTENPRFKTATVPVGDVPVYQLRANESGGEEMTANVIGVARRVPVVDNVKDAYALQIRGKVMLRRYLPGDVVVVNPVGIPRQGSGVVLMTEDRGDVQIGEYVSETDTEIELKFTGAEVRLARFPRSKFTVMHSICAVYPA